MVVGGRAILAERRGSGAIVEPFIAKVATLDFDTVQIEIARALPNLDSDPEDAVTAACSLVEAVCRSILIELKLPLPPKKDIDGLIRAVQEPLGLSPGRSGLPAEIEADIRQTLSGLTSVAKGIGALRTHAGDAHGREKGFRRIDPRIARLALNAASSLALFLIETWERQQHRRLPQHPDEHDRATESRGVSLSSTVSLACDRAAVRRFLNERQLIAVDHSKADGRFPPPNHARLIFARWSAVTRLTCAMLHPASSAVFAMLIPASRSPTMRRWCARSGLRPVYRPALLAISIPSR